MSDDLRPTVPIEAQHREERTEAFPGLPHPAWHDPVAHSPRLTWCCVRPRPCGGRSPPVPPEARRTRAGQTRIPRKGIGVNQQTIVTLDLEGVLVPEIWIAVAERTGIEALRRTTRDEPDYDVLMRGRIELLGRHELEAERDPGGDRRAEPVRRSQGVSG